MGQKLEFEEIIGTTSEVCGWPEISQRPKPILAGERNFSDRCLRGASTDSPGLTENMPRAQVQELYELSAEYEGKLEELGNVLTSLDPGDSIVISKAFSHILNLANLAEEVQIAYRRRIKKLKKGDFVDESSATTESDIEETFKRLVSDLGKSPEEIFDALKNQTLDRCFRSMTVTMSLYLHFATSVIDKITTALGIYCFRIRRKEA